MAKPKPAKTIDQVLNEFLAEQQARWSHATYAKYEMIVGLLKAYMERYWPGHNDEYDWVTKAGGTYCGTYGPEDIAGAFGMFLDFSRARCLLGKTVERVQWFRKSRPAKGLAARANQLGVTWPEGALERSLR